MLDTMTRRRALGVGIAALGAATARDGRAEPPAPNTRHRVHEVAPLSADAKKLAGLSARLIESHHQKNYAGAVKQLNAIREKLGRANPDASASYWSEYGTLKAGEAAARNSAVLHELYFENLTSKRQPIPGPLLAAVKARFATPDRLISLMRGCAKATSGWVVLAMDHDSATLDIVQTSDHAGGAWHATPLIVLDMFEHSYALDYGPNKSGYLDAFFANLAWAEVGRRYQRAS